MAVHATFPEAIAVASKLTEQQSTKLSHYVDQIKKSQQSWTGLKSYLKDHRQQLGPCPFLNSEGSCTIYTLRPLSCRALLSTRPAAWCTVDFSELDDWDKRAYESSLDCQVVAWPTHYVAATQDFGQKLEKTLLESMLKEKGWALAGNFAVMVWLEQTCHLSQYGSTDELHDTLSANNLDNRLLLNLTVGNQ